MKKTFLYDTHVRLGAKMGPFGGYDMPIQYESIVAEHRYTRTAATLFDTCHMGEFLIEGPDACNELEAIVSCDVSSLNPGRCKYGFLCNEQGGVLDDQITYRLSPTSFFMVVNASTADADFSWLAGHCGGGTSLVNVSDKTAKIDLQGPKSVGIAAKLIDARVAGLSYYSFMHSSYKGADVLISRTGYTGEVGFEVYLDAVRVAGLWDECMELGAKPAGLGARDTLRLEMGYPLYGHELTATRNAAEANFTHAIARDKTFIGSSAMRSCAPVGSLLSGIRLYGRRAARPGDGIFDQKNRSIGTITSGSFAPSLGYAVALGYLRSEACRCGAAVVVGNDRCRLEGTITETPFYKNATARRPISDFLP